MDFCFLSGFGTEQLNAVMRGGEGGCGERKRKRHTSLQFSDLEK